FHSGRLSKEGHNYDSGISLSAFEFGGVIREVTDAGIVLEVKNRIEAGDVLEFLPPGGVSVIRLRKYSFVCSATGKVSEKVTAGEQRAIQITWSEFHAEAPSAIRRLLQPGLVARKARPLTEEQNEALKHQEAIAQLEADSGQLISPDALTNHPARARRPQR